MTISKTEPPPPPNLNGGALESLPDIQDLLPMLLGQADIAPNGCDVETYLTMMDKRFDMCEADKRALIHMLWQLCETVIGVQFGVDPVQIARGSGAETTPTPLDFMVQSQSQTQSAFKHATDTPAIKRKKG